MPKNKHKRRRFKSRSYEELGDWAIPWIVVLGLLCAAVYCAATAQPAYSTGALLLVLGSLVRSRRGSDP